MKLIDNSIAETSHAFGNDDETFIRIYYDFWPAEPEQPNPDLPGLGPGCAAEISINIVEQYGPEIDPHIWLEFDGYSEEEAQAWAAEILELKNKGDDQ